VILEGLNLSAVTPGEYQLICLPLRIEGCDGAPARAVLVE
jgi:arylformamidase